ncbi:radical SAM protein [Bacteriovorax stolpii]|uniref:Radical SAM protein n=1 Tax=Bacteriovorax stolpii TaxID=960 RepID=A0A2K9NUE8_BACTC|nr:arsenosugar biosynthesis radical SAM (seleno)protein ArsS [Bacteriovorax stolpii]AUN99128.1 radical SAM protein [Bacteriovorax stolpii]TDP55340.1 radical SAM/Cys-rich protein [Bacteriovorax stolpii]
MSNVVAFAKKIRDHQINLKRSAIETLQINVGKLCNQACHHCHVEAGPLRTEIMSEETIDRIIALIEKTPTLKTIDLTGGAPELNPSFRKLVLFARSRNLEVIDRCNLTVFYEKGQEDLPQFLKDNKIHVIASLPCYTKDNVDKQRGRGVFDKSVEALKLLNSLGYGVSGTGLALDLVYNPGGAFLPGAQEKLQADYKRELKHYFNIEFNNLFTITNMPIKRFLEDLNRQGKYESYMELLVNNFNPKAADSVMCKTLVSIGWDGQVYDCDFNQMLELPAAAKKITLWDFENFNEFVEKTIALGDHCYGCTAGAGSSCGGALT